MNLTSDQRRDINRENSLKSTGPKTEEGKARSRGNATKHGLTAAIPMPDEDPAVVAARSSTWNHYYKPTSPGAQHFLNVCVQSTILSDRLTRYHDSTVADQVRRADSEWLCDKQNEVQTLKENLDQDSTRMVRRLSLSAIGSSCFAGRWKALLHLDVELLKAS